MQNHLRYIAPVVTIFLGMHAASGEEISLNRKACRAATAAVFSALPSPEKKDTLLRFLPDIMKSLVREGGYRPSEICRITGIKDTEQARIAKVLRQLDGIEANISNRHDAKLTKESGALLLAVPLAMAYAKQPKHGTRAAGRLVALVSDDLHAASCGRTICSLLAAILAGNTDKDKVLRNAAAAAGDDEMRKQIASVRIMEWRHLQTEKTLTGKLQRCLYIWYRATNFKQSIAQGRKLLATSETAALLLTLSAATFPEESLPEKKIATTARNRKTEAIHNDLWQLADAGILLPVKQKQKPARKPRRLVTTSHHDSRDKKNIAKTAEQ